MATPREPGLSQSVIQALQQPILSGELQPGDRFPSEREWSERLGVSRQLVREALRVLEVNGLVERRARGGTYVAAGDMRQAFLPILLRIRAGGQFLNDIMEMRRIIEPQLAALAARRADDQDIARIKQIEAELSRRDEAAQTSAPYDAEFHIAIAEATKNRALAAFMAGLGDVFGLWRSDVLRQRAARSLGPSRQAIVRSLERRDSAGAHAAMLLHIDQIRDMLGVGPGPSV